MPGLLLILIDVISRLKVRRKALVAACVIVLLLAAGATHGRAAAWSSPVALWEDTVSKSPAKFRVHFQLASAYYDSGRCDLAVAEFQRAMQLGTTESILVYNLLVDWALAYDCLGETGNALAKLRQAAAREPTAHVYSQIGMIYAKSGRWAEALDELARAERIDPRYAPTYCYRGGVHLSTNQPAAAVADYQRALSFDPSLQQAKDGLALAQSRLRQGQ